MKSSKLFKHTKVRYVVAAILTGLVLTLGGYYVHASNHCANLTSKRSSYIKNGEMYIQLKDRDGSPRQHVKRDVFLDMCMSEKLHF